MNTDADAARRRNPSVQSGRGVPPLGLFLSVSIRVHPWLKDPIKIMLPTNLQSSIDAMLLSVAPQIATAQALHVSARGRCWQGKLTHTAIPADGALAAPNVDAKPTDQTTSWRDIGIALPSLMEAALSIEAYLGPQGSGYVIHAHVISGGVRYRRAIHSGPETWREQNWTAMKVVNLL
jgi:hypothetical protein